jgi:hypothetical protein
MLEAMMSAAIDKKIKTEYPHLELPAAVYAKVTKVQQLSEGYEYNLKILDEIKEVNESFPEIPGVMSEIALEAGDIAVVLLLYGKLNVFVVGKVI